MNTLVDWRKNMIEPEIPKFVADIIERLKYENKPLDICLLSVYSCPDDHFFNSWVMKNFEKFINAWIFGYKVTEKLYYIQFLQHDESSYFLADYGHLSDAYRWHISKKDVRFFKDRVLTPVFTMQEIDDNFPQFKEFAIPVNKDEEVDV